MNLKTHHVLALAALAVLAVSIAFGHPMIAHDQLAGLSGLAGAPFMIGDISEIKTLISKQGEAWEEFKRTNDALLKAKADGKAVGDLEAKLARLSDGMDAVTETLAALQKSQLGGGSSAAGSMGLGVETKAFNSIRASYSEQKYELARPVTADEVVAYKSAFFKAIRSGPDSLNVDERKSLQAGDSGQGGFMLPPSTIGRAVAKLYELSPIRQIASVQEISTQSLEGLYDNDEASYGWVGEAAARPATNTPTVGRWRIETFEMYAMPEASQTLLDDAGIDVESWLAGKVANKFARVEGAAFLNGTGKGQPRGFTTYTMVATPDSTRTWGQIEIVKTGVNGDFAASNPADHLFTLIAAFKTGYLGNATWVTTREVMGKIRKFKDSTNAGAAYMWQPGLSKGVPDTLLGYPIVLAQDLPALSSNIQSLWLGDFREAYQIVDRLGFRTLRDPFTNKPFVRFYTQKRVGGGVLNFEALKAIQFST